MSAVPSTSETPLVSGAAIDVGSKVMTASECVRFLSQLDALTPKSDVSFTLGPHLQDMTINDFRALALKTGYEPSIVDSVLSMNYPSTERVIADLGRLRSKPSPLSVEMTYHNVMMETLTAAYPGLKFNVRYDNDSNTPRGRGFKMSFLEESVKTVNERCGFLWSHSRCAQRTTTTEKSLLDIVIGDYGRLPFIGTVNISMRDPHCIALAEPLERVHSVFEKDYQITVTHDIVYPAGGFMAWKQ